MLVTVRLLVAALLFLAPGYGIVLFLFKGKRLDLLEWIGWICLLASALWSVLFELAGPSTLSWSGLGWLVGGLSLVLIVHRICRLKSPVLPSRKDLWRRAGILLFVASFRCLPMLYCAAPPGADMSMHCGITRLICLNDGEPTTMRPLLPVDVFAGYPTGFHAIAAIFALRTGLSPDAAAFGVACASHALTLLVFFLFFKTQMSDRGAILGAWLVSFASYNPQDYLGWGGNPTVLSLLLCVGALTCLEYLAEEQGSARWAIPCSLLIAGAVAVHPIPPFCMAFLWPAWYGPRLWPVWNRGKRERIRVCAVGCGILLLAVFFLLPLLLKDRAHVSEWEIEWVKDWQRSGGGAWHGTLLNSPVTVPRFVGRVLGWAPFLLAPPGFLLCLHKDRLRAVQCLLVATFAFLLILNSHHWILPFSFVLYPERVAVLLLLPVGFLSGLSLERLASHPRCRAVAWGLLLGWGAFLASSRYLLTAYTQTAVTRADAKAIAWLKEHASPQDLVANDYGDAGLWIPALAGRPITMPHVNPFIMEEARNGLSGRVPEYIYLGAKQVYPSHARELVALLEEREFRPVFGRDGVMILRSANRPLSEGGTAPGPN